MKIMLYFLALLALLAPVLLWAGFESALCGHTNSAKCSLGLEDFVDEEFAMIAALPWALAVLLFAFAKRRE